MRIAKSALLVGALALAGCSQEPAVKQGAEQASTGASQQATLASQLQSAVVGATGYAPGAVQVTATGAQVIVNITDSRLLDADHAARDAEAAKVSGSLASALGAGAAGAAIQAIHVNYLDRGGKVVDGIDFRRSPDGRFVRDIT